MARFKEAKNSFLGGEVSPKIYGRSDLAVFKNGCEDVLNAIIYPQGGAGRRPGTYVFDPTNFADKTSLRMFPLVISKTQAYVFVITTGTVAVVGGGDNTITTGVAVINASTGVIGAIEYAFSGITNANQYEGLSNFTHLPQIQYVQQGTTIFFAHADFPPFCIEYQGTDTFRLLNHWAYAQLGRDPFGSLVNSEVAKSWPFDTRNLSTTSMTPAATTGNNITVTCNAGNTVTSAHIGSPIRITDAGGAKTGVAIIRSVLSSLTFKVDILVAFGATTASTNWALSQWGKTTGRGYPRSVTCFEQRLYHGGNIIYPTGIWGSEIGNFANQRQEHYIDDSPNTIVNSDPYSVILTAGDLSAIQWLSPGKTLVIGTLGREVIGQGPDETQALGPLNVSFVPQTAYGSSPVQPVRAQNTVRFVTRSGEKIRELNFNLLEDTYKAPELTAYAEHCARKNIDINADLDREINVIVEMCHQESDNGITWCRDICGCIFGITRDRDAEINAFHFHKIGGSYLNRDEGQVLSICTVPAVTALGNHDDVWVAVRRTINGVGKTFIEIMTKQFNANLMYNPSTLVQNKPILCDAAIWYTNVVPQTTIPVAHLPSTEVEVIADGIYLGKKTTDGSGNLTLTTAASEVIAGLSYRTLIKPLNLEAGSVVGSAQGTMKKVDEVDLRFHRTIGAKFGPSLTQLQSVNFRSPTDPQNDPIKLFTGDKTIKFPAGHSRQAYVVIVQDLPLPFEITSIISRGMTND